MTDPEKIDKIFSLVSKTDARMAVLETKFPYVEQSTNECKQRIGQAEEDIEDLQIHQSNVGLVGRAGFFLLGILGGMAGSVVVAIVLHFMLK